MDSFELKRVRGLRETAGMTSDAVQRLLDKQDIHEVLMRYARGIDRFDFDLVQSCYHPGAADDHGDFKGTIEEFTPWVEGRLARFESTMHFLGNVLIEFGDDPDVAWVETYCVAYHRLKDEDIDSIAGVRYADRFERRHAGGDAPEWRIADRKVVVDWNRLDQVEALGFSPAYVRGVRGPADPVWSRSIGPS